MLSREGAVEHNRLLIPVDLDWSAWCSDCEPYRLIYPDYRCARHRGGKWDLEEAVRRFERARKQMQAAEKFLAKVVREARIV